MPQPASRRFSGIFISYRRDDSSGHAGRLFDRLSEHFGDEQIFMDIDQIEPGQDFVQTIEEAVGSCEILLTVIGKHWLSSADGDLRRLDNPHDFVRLEVAAALRRNIRVIPVLVQGATMPRPEDLPDELSQLSRRHAIELSDQRWRHDITRLIATLTKVLAEREDEWGGSARWEENRRRHAEGAGRKEREAEEVSREEEESERGMREAEGRLGGLAARGPFSRWFKGRSSLKKQRYTTASFDIARKVEGQIGSKSKRLKTVARAAAVVLVLGAAVASVAWLMGRNRQSTDASLNTSSVPESWPQAGQKTPESAAKADAANLKLQAIELINSGQHEEAIRVATQAIALDPQFADAYVRRGIAYGLRGENSRAIDDFTEAIRLDPESTLAYANRGISYNDIKNYDGAITDATEAIRLDPRFALAYLARGVAYGRKGEHYRAIADYTEAIRFNPTLTLAYDNRANIFEHLGMKEHAAADRQEAEKLKKR